MQYDVFISHASEDKATVARPLANHLAKLGLRVWLDEFELTIGDSLRRSIDKGLANSAFGVVILSQEFFRKEWPNKELDGLAAREDGKAKVILPVWHGVTREEVEAFSPMLADKLAAKTDAGFASVAEGIYKAVSRHRLSGHTATSQQAKPIFNSETPTATARPESTQWRAVALGGAVVATVLLGQIVLYVMERSEPLSDQQRYPSSTGTSAFSSRDPAAVIQPPMPPPGTKSPESPASVPALPAPAPKPKPKPLEPWLTFRYDLFWCDQNPTRAEKFAKQVQQALLAAGVMDVRIKRYDDTFRAIAKADGFSSLIYSPAAIRFYGAKEEEAAGIAARYLRQRLAVDFELEEVDPASPTPGILSAFLCPGFPP